MKVSSRLTQLKAIADKHRITVYQLGSAWVMISGPTEYRQETQLPYWVVTKREAYEYAIEVQTKESRP